MATTLALAPLGCVVQIDGQLDVGADEQGDEADDTTVNASHTTADDSFDDTDDTGTDDTGMAETGDTGMVESSCVEAIDILFVIDNSGSMGASQRQVADAIGSMVERLDQAGMDWRIGVTTTDTGNPWCPAGTTTPESGALVGSSCRTRLDDFLFSDTVDVQASACTEVCSTQDIALANDQPWVESFDGVSNTPDTVEALRCLLPQGVNGCGFESPLEAMRLALLRASEPGEASFGFLRPQAQLAVVLISDEVDCSSADAGIFAQDGDKAFWSDPTSAFPTSAVCWNAGVVCSGAGPVFDNCVPADKAGDGSLTDDPSLAVLHPLGRYTDLLGSLEQAKQAIDPAAKVRVFGVVGLGTDGALHYEDVGATDPAYQDSFGIGPGCEGPVEGESAVPPVRMRSLINQFEGSMHSICKDQFIDAFVTIANRVSLECLQ